MLITGYHGTIAKNAYNIINEGKYQTSSKSTEWLGPGIYFYDKFFDAFIWKPKHKAETAVLHSVIEVEESEYLDIDTPDGEKVWKQILDYVCEVDEIELEGTHQENQCSACKMIWKSYPHLKVLAASFATTPSKVKLLIDKRPRRKEFCVRDNSVIKCTQIINYRG